MRPFETHPDTCRKVDDVKRRRSALRTGNDVTVTALWEPCLNMC